jgi:hypothetical protein
MGSITSSALDRFLNSFSEHPATATIRLLLKESAVNNKVKGNLEPYEKSISFLENIIQTREASESLIALYQAIFREMEALIDSAENARRHKFVFIIPVADRPQHLRDCLNSLLVLCNSFHYGGVSKQKYAKVSVLIADDSKETGNINEIKGIVDQFNQNGLEILYFGQHEQLEQIDRLGETIRQQLSHVIGNLDRSSFYHKGASITRNIAYLKLNELRKKERNLIFYFIDSDQEFKININAENRNREVYAINYLYYLDRIFSRTDSQILTGKVVGDPPVSPSVMAGKFLEDVIGFLSQISKLEPGHSCQFHTKEVHPSDDAAYHDMAGLFGFKPAVGSFHYQCTIAGEHNHRECLTHFSGKLNRFFDGEHPTRHTYYKHSDIFASIQPARTLYTGNYAFKPECLKFFIPFAPLKLRMAGPTLGRLMKAGSLNFVLASTGNKTA